MQMNVSNSKTTERKHKMTIDETNTPEAINDYYDELISSMFVLAGRRPELKTTLADEVKQLLNEKRKALEDIAEN